MNVNETPNKLLQKVVVKEPHPNEKALDETEGLPEDSCASSLHQPAP